MSAKFPRKGGAGPFLARSLYVQFSEFLMFRIFRILNFRKVELCAFGTQNGPFIFLYDFSLPAAVIIHKW